MNRFFYYLKAFLGLLSLVFLVQWGYKGTVPPKFFIAFWGIAYVIHVGVEMIYEHMKQKLLSNFDENELKEIIEKVENAHKKGENNE
jgi:hypothetical protein